MENRVAAVIAAHKRHGRGGIVSVCSAHPAVIRAAEELAREYGRDPPAPNPPRIKLTNLAAIPG